MPSPRHPAHTQLALAADWACDVFYSQCRRYHAPALKATNIMQLLDLLWFRTECDHTLRTRLGPDCHNCFDLVSKYLLTLKIRYYLNTL